MDKEIIAYDDHRQPTRIVLRRIPRFHREITQPKLPTYYYHYSNPASQGALICETKGFPDYYNPRKEDLATAYSDRIRSWSQERFNAACTIAGGGDQIWSRTLPQLSDAKLKAFATVALDLKVKPKHVRVIHYFNVSNGYSCSLIVALLDKPIVKKSRRLADTR